MNKCSLCNKVYDDLQELPYDDSPHLNRKYCSRCFPEVYSFHINSPWFDTIKKKIIEERNKRDSKD